MGSKNRCNIFSTEFLDWHIQSKKVESKKLFFDCVRRPDLGFSRRSPFSTDRSDCVGNSRSLCAVFN